MKKLIKKSQQFHSEINKSNYIMRDFNHPYIFIVADFFPTGIPKEVDWERSKKFNIPRSYTLTTYVGSELTPWTRWKIKSTEHESYDLNSVFNQMKIELLGASKNPDVLKYIPDAIKTTENNNA